MLASRFLADARHLVTGTLFGQLIGLGASPILTRIFSPNDFGIFSTLFAAAMFMAAFGALRLEDLIPALPVSLEALRLVQFIIALSVANAVLVLFVILFLGDDLAPLLSIPESGTAVLLMLPVLIIAFGTYSGVRAWAVRQARYADVGRAQIFRAVIMVGVPIVIGITGLVRLPGCTLALGQALGFFAFVGLLLQGFNERELRILATPSWRKIKYALNANAGLVRATALAQIIAAVHGRLTILVIASVYGTTEAGFYALAERIADAPATLISRAIGDVYRQRAAKAHREGKSFLSLFRNVAILAFVLSATAYSTAYLIVPPHMGLIFGSGWDNSAFTMSVLLISTGFSFWTTALDNTAIIVGARGYIVLWQSLRLAIEGGAALAAMSGALSYETYLVWLVVGRVLLFVSDIVAMHEFSRLGRGF